MESSFITSEMQNGAAAVEMFNVEVKRLFISFPQQFQSLVCTHENWKHMSTHTKKICTWMFIGALFTIA